MNRLTQRFAATWRKGMQRLRGSFRARVLGVLTFAFVAAYLIHFVGAKALGQQTTMPTTARTAATTNTAAPTTHAAAFMAGSAAPGPASAPASQPIAPVPPAPVKDGALHQRSTDLNPDDAAAPVPPLNAPTARDMLGYYQGMAQHLSISLTALGLAVAAIGILTWKSYHDLIGNLRKEVEKEKADWEAQKKLIDDEFAAKKREAVQAIQAATSEMLKKSAKATEVLQELESTRAIVNKMLGDVEAVAARYPQPSSEVAPAADGSDLGTRAAEAEASADDIEAESAKVSEALRKIEPNDEQNKGPQNEG